MGPDYPDLLGSPIMFKYVIFFEGVEANDESGGVAKRVPNASSVKSEQSIM